MVYQPKNKIYFINLKDVLPTMASSLRDLFTEYLEGYIVEARNYMEVILCFWMQIGKRIRLEYHYGLLCIGLQTERRVYLQLHQGKTINSENSTRRFRNVEQFTRSVHPCPQQTFRVIKNGHLQFFVFQKVWYIRVTKSIKLKNVFVRFLFYGYWKFVTSQR